MVKITWTSLSRSKHISFNLVWVSRQQNPHTRMCTHTNKQFLFFSFQMTISVLLRHNNMSRTWLSVCGKTEVHTLYVCPRVIVGCSGIKWCSYSLQPAEQPLPHCPLQLPQKEAKTKFTVSIKCCLIQDCLADTAMQHGRLKDTNILFRGIYSNNILMELIMHS